MQVIVESKNLDVTPALREHTTKQARKLTKLHKKIEKIRVFLETVKKKSNDPLANQVTYEVAIPGKNVIVKSHAPDMYDAIVKATDGAVRQLRKVFEKKRTLRRGTEVEE